MFVLTSTDLHRASKSRVTRPRSGSTMACIATCSKCWRPASGPTADFAHESATRLRAPVRTRSARSCRTAYVLSRKPTVSQATWEERHKLSADQHARDSAQLHTCRSASAGVVALCAPVPRNEAHLACDLTHTRTHVA